MTRAKLNRQVILTSRPDGIPQAANFQLVETPIPALLDGGQLLVRNLYLSVEPAMRGWINAAANYSEPVPLGSVMRSFATGCVEESRHPHFTRGDYVTGLFGWQEYAVVPADSARRITDLDVPLSTSLGVLGLNGLTAYVALLDIGRPKPGETVVVSTAAGAVGSVVGQIAKLNGCRTVGIAGGAAKVAMCLSEFRFDDAVDYKSGDLDSRLAAACPAGVDVYFDNTAGAISDAVIPRLNVGARVVVCGTASIAQWAPRPLGPRIERDLLTKRASMQGFLALDHEHRRPEAMRFLSRCVRDGSLRYREDVLEGLHEAPGAIARLYRGENMRLRASLPVVTSPR
jgi:NADPH-dependent curcumin reductase CurA